MSASHPDWLAERQAEARERFEAVGFPTKKLEDWKYTHEGLFPFAKTPYALAAAYAPGSITLPETVGLAPAESFDIVFVDGHFAEDLSSPVSDLPAGVQISTLLSAIAHGNPQVRAQIDGDSPFADHPMRIHNCAELGEGAVIHVDKNVELAAPIHLVFVATGRQPEIASHPRVLMQIEANARATLLESHVALEGATEVPYWTNSVVDLRVAQGAGLEHVRLHDEGKAAVHTSCLSVTQERDSQFTGFSFALGGQLVRSDVVTTLAGQGANCVTHALYPLQAGEHADYNLIMDHAVPHCDSEQLYKGVLDDRSVGTFSGKVVVREQAQKSNAEQSNRNLLLTDQATANTKPQLEIYADDVKCAHGATVGQLDDDALFYLRARGIGPAEARRLLTYAFAAEVVERVKDPGLRERLEALVHQKLEA